MSKKILTEVLLIAQMAGGLIDNFGKPDSSTSTNNEVCPNCGKAHKSNKHLYCSKECYMESKKDCT